MHIYLIVTQNKFPRSRDELSLFSVSFDSVKSVTCMYVARDKKGRGKNAAKCSDAHTHTGKPWTKRKESLEVGIGANVYHMSDLLRMYHSMYTYMCV